MTSRIFHGAPWLWLRTTLAAGLVVGCLWASFRGIQIAVQNGYLWLPAPTVALFALKTELNATLSAAVFFVLACALAFTISHTVLTLLRVPSRSAEVGAAAWMVILLLYPIVGYRLNKTDWFPPFWSLAGIVSNVLVATLFLGFGIAAWLLLRRIRDQLEGAVGPLVRMCNRKTVLAFGLYWLVVNLAFHGLNLRSSSLARADNLSRPRLVLIGLDGAAWDVLDPLLRQGRLPNLRRLTETGAFSPLRTMEPTLSPIIWTTIATGKPMSAHGITGFTVQEPGRDQGKLMTSNMRRVKALWNILSERHRSVGVVGWFVTWPAEAVNGVVVSSYAGVGRTWKSGRATDIPEQMYPAELSTELEPVMQATEADLERRFRQIFPRLAMARLNETQRAVVEDTREVLLADLLNASAGLHLLEKHSPDFFAVYLGGIDVVGHRFWKYMHPTALPYDVTTDEVEMFADVVSNYYVLADELIGRIAGASDENTLVMVISDHGMGPYIPQDGNDDRVSGHHHDALPGILILSGEQVRRGPLSARPSIFDVAPTVLHVLDLPMAEDMSGLPVIAAFADDFLHHRPPQYVRSYENGARRANGDSARQSDVDGRLKERLKSLGYLE